MSLEYWEREFKGALVTVVITMITFGGYMLEYERTLDPYASGYGFLFFLFSATLLLYLIYILYKANKLRRLIRNE